MKTEADIVALAIAAGCNPEHAVRIWRKTFGKCPISSCSEQARFDYGYDYASNADATNQPFATADGAIIAWRDYYQVMATEGTPGFWVHVGPIVQGFRAYQNGA
jgi:hypothetical protein